MLGVVRRNPKFRRLWMAQVVSRLGDWFNRVAVLTLIGQLSGGEALIGLGTMFGVETALRLLPSTLFGTLAGSAADRFPRRFLMVSADLARAAVVAALLLVQHPAQLPLLYALLFLQMAIGIFFEAAQQAAIPGTLDPTDLHAAYELTAATWSMMLTVGALLGGVCVELIGVRGVFLVDSATYLASAALIAPLRLAAVPEHPQPFRWRDVAMLRDLKRGLAHARERGVAPIVFTKASWGAAGGFLVLLAVAGRTRFGDLGAGASTNGGAAETAPRAGLAIGLLYAARGLGTGIGPIVSRRLFGSEDRSLRRQITGGFVVGALFYAVFGFAATLPPAMLFIMIAHCGGSTIWVSSTTCWQRHVDDPFRGRVFAMEFMGMTLASSTGSVIAGVVYDATGSLEHTALIVSGIVLCAGLLWTWFARHVGTAPARPGEPAKPGEPGEPAAPADAARTLSKKVVPEGGDSW